MTVCVCVCVCVCMCEHKCMPCPAFSLLFTRPPRPAFLRMHLVCVCVCVCVCVYVNASLLADPNLTLCVEWGWVTPPSPSRHFSLLSLSKGLTPLNALWCSKKSVCVCVCVCACVSLCVCVSVCVCVCQQDI